MATKKARTDHDSPVVSLEENLLSIDVNSLLANGHFLQEKLQPGMKMFD
jgi:hypothetical protein